MTSPHCIAEGHDVLILDAGIGRDGRLDGEGVLGPLLEAPLVADGGRGSEEKRFRLDRPALRPFGLLGGGLGVLDFEL